MPKLFSLFILTLLTSTVAMAQLPVLAWAKDFTNSTENNIYRDMSNGRTVAVDKQGNVYSAGLFQYSIDLDPGPNVYQVTAANNSQTGIYISKLDRNGNFVWGKELPVLVEWGQIEMKVDAKGNVYLASDFSEEADMDPGPGILMLKPTGFRDAFVIKLDTDGNLTWIKQFGGPGDTGPRSTAIDVDSNYNVIVSGFFNNTVDFDPGPGVYNLTSTAHFQTFVVKLNTTGDLVWAEQVGNAPIIYSGEIVNDMKCDKQGNIYSTGTFVGVCDFDPGPQVYSLTGVSIMDGFVSKLDANGNFVWAKRLGNNENDLYQYLQPRGIDLDNEGNVITTGQFNGNIDFDPGPAEHILSNYQFGVGEGFILKLNNSGNLVWVNQVGGPQGGSSNDIATDAYDNIYMAGDFTRETDFDPGQKVFNILGPGEYFSAFMKLDAQGNFIYATAFQVNNEYSGGCYMRRMIVDDAQNLYITGSMGGTVDFDISDAVYNVSATMDESPYVVKLSRCPNPTTAELHVSACSSYTLNNEIFDSSGIYKRTIPNSSGCDSLITLYLTITKKDTLQTIIICEGDSFFAGGAYQTIAGTYIDSLRTTAGCDSVVTTQLIVHSKPHPDLGTDKDVCNNTTVTLTPGNFSAYLWQDMSTQSNLPVNAVGTYWVKVTNEFSCSAYDTLTIKSILPAPLNFLKFTDSICTYESIQLAPNETYKSYTWSTGETSKNISITKPGKYWLTVTDANNCSGSDTTNIIQKQCMHGIFIPSAFTPNADGKNDVFKPVVFGNVLKYHFIIYNRWGQTVFQTSDPQQGWNGRTNGVAQDAGTFIWICNCELEGSKEEYKKGTVVLLR